MAFEAAEREPSADAQRRLLTFVIVGGGPTGAELAGALAEIARQTLRQDFRNIRPESARIVLLEGAPHLLNAFPAPLREAARAVARPPGRRRPPQHGRHGRRRRRCPVSLAGSRRAAARADGPLGRGRGSIADCEGARCAARSRRPRARRADARGSGPSGDLRRRRHLRVEPGRRAAAGSGAGGEAGGRPRGSATSCAPIRGEPLAPFRYRNYGNMATIGRGSAVADIGPIKASGFLAWLIWLFIHIFWLIGFRNRIAVLSEWAWSYLTFQRRVRSDYRTSPDLPGQTATSGTQAVSPDAKTDGDLQRPRVDGP